MMNSTFGLYSEEFKALCDRHCPQILALSRQNNELKGIEGRISKLNPRERLLSCILYLRLNDFVHYEVVNRDYSRTLLLSDVYFICSVVCEVMENEIAWSCDQQKISLRVRTSRLTGWIGIIDGASVQIYRPRIEEDRSYYNGRRKIYSFNNIVVVDHDGFIIYIDPSFYGSYHNVRCLRGSGLGRNWQNYFKVDHDSSYPVEYLLDNPEYLKMDHFILRKIVGREIEDFNKPVISAFNKYHSDYGVLMEWGIGELKSKFRKFSALFPNRRDIFDITFTSADILTNYLHRRRKEFSSQFELSEDGTEGVEMMSYSPINFVA